jgi:hypothetical protein
MSDTCESCDFFEMLWKWFEERRGAEDMRPERHTGLSADDFKVMLDEHEANLTAEKQETEQLFELQAEADRRAVAAWKAAHPDRPLTSPDRCDMVVWLMEELAEARETIRLQHATILSQANALQEAARRRLFSNKMVRR